MTNVLRIGDLSLSEIERVLELATMPELPSVFSGRGAALVFEHPSARTRNAAEMAVAELGGHPVTIRGEEIGFDVRESVEDIARVLACYHALIAARVASHTTLERMTVALAAAGVQVPVVNLLSPTEHPTQALADLLTIQQSLGHLKGVTVAFIGDANNVARSLGDGLARFGATLRVAAPEGFQFGPDDIERVGDLGGELVLTDSPRAAAEGADVLYTDVWVSMGEDPSKRAAFSGYTIDEALCRAAAPHAIVLHCLPAHRGEEISAAVMDGPRSQVWQQAANRLHAMRGLFALLLGERSEQSRR